MLVHMYCVAGKQEVVVSCKCLENPTGLRVLLVDDNALVRAGVRSIIESSCDNAVVVEVSSGEEGIVTAETDDFDIVFMDVELPGLDGFSSAMKLLKVNPALKIILLTGFSNKPVPKALLQSGLRGYMLKASAVGEISAAIQAVCDGGMFFSPGVVSKFVLDTNQSTSEEKPFDRLSERELQVVLLLLRGYTTGSASDTLSVSSKTVSTYKSRAYTKLKVQSTAELVTLAISCGLIEASRPRGT